MIKYFLLIKFLILCFKTQEIINCSPEITFHYMSDEDIKSILDSHNQQRSVVALGNQNDSFNGNLPSGANINLLVWDETLQKKAQDWANNITANCKEIDHNPDLKSNNVENEYIGENIYWAGLCHIPDNNNWTDAIMSWYSEVKDFDPELIDLFKYQDPEKATIGHFTQLIWADTTKVGCGATVYSDDNWPYNILVVCNYKKSGNIIDEKIYLKGNPGSKCLYSVSTKYPGLCDCREGDTKTCLGKFSI